MALSSEPINENVFLYCKIKQIRGILGPGDDEINDAAPVKHMQMRPKARMNGAAFKATVGRGWRSVQPGPKRTRPCGENLL